MKHQELLDKIYWHWRRDNRGADGLQPMVDYRRALLVVVELHRPEEIRNISGDVLESYCFECEGLIDYPCPTIQVIEKELK